MKRLVSAVCAATFIVTAGAASALEGPLFYECDITKRNKNVGWLSSKVGVIVTKSGQVLVTDSVIQNFFDGPQPAKARTRGKKLLVDWTLSNLKDSDGQIAPKFAYRAAIDTTNNSVVLSANPVAFPQRWTGRGTCSLRKS